MRASEYNPTGIETQIFDFQLPVIISYTTCTSNVFPLGTEQFWHCLTPVITWEPMSQCYMAACKPSTWWLKILIFCVWCGARRTFFLLGIAKTWENFIAFVQCKQLACLNAAFQWNFFFQQRSQLYFSLYKLAYIR